MKKKLHLFSVYARSILQLSGPLIIGQLGFVLMGVTDTVMVGHVSADALAAAGVANAVFFLVMVISMGVGSVISPLVAQSHSTNDRKHIRDLYNNGIVVSLVLGIALTCIVALMGFNFQWFGQKPEVEQLAREFTLILSISSLPFTFFFFMKQISDGASRVVYSMTVTIIGLLLNLLLCWVFIFGHWGSAAWGLNGAGWATLITRVVMALLMWAILRYLPYFKKLIDRKAGKFYKPEVFKKILQLGLPAGFQYFFEIGAFSGAAFLIGWLGKYQLAAHNIAISLASVTYMVVSGVAIAASIKVGQALGQKKMLKVRRTGIAAIGTGLLIMSLFALLFLLFDKPLVKLYTNDADVAVYASGLIIIAGFFQLFDGAQAIGLGILRGVADVNIPTLVTFLAYWGIGLPVGYYLAFVQGEDVYGIWIALLLGLLFAAVCHTLRFLWLTKKA